MFGASATAVSWQTPDVDREQARIRAWALYRQLEQIANRDGEQEVAGVAVPVLDALLTACRTYVADDPVAQAVDGLMTPEAVEDRQLRAIDAALVVHQLALALGPERKMPSPRSRGGGSHDWST